MPRPVRAPCPACRACQVGVAPTLSVEEVDKRIQELKTVQYWLEQNGHALKATIQALEVQKMTLGLDTPRHECPHGRPCQCVHANGHRLGNRLRAHSRTRPSARARAFIPRRRAGVRAECGRGRQGGRRGRRAVRCKVEAGERFRCICGRRRWRRRPSSVVGRADAAVPANRGFGSAGGVAIEGAGRGRCGGQGDGTPRDKTAASKPTATAGKKTPVAGRRGTAAGKSSAAGRKRASGR